VRDIADAHPDAEAVIVSHNLALHTLLCHAMGIPLRAFRQFRIDLASLTVLEIVRADRWSVVTLNERCHLADEAPLREASGRS
jgi:broad specificity phosphatase PhoE